MHCASAGMTNDYWAFLCGSAFLSLMFQRNAHNKGGYVYIVSNAHRTVFYTGVTADLLKRADAHAGGVGAGFPAKYNCSDLVYYEEHPTIELAIAREKSLKRWKRAWKLELIQSVNPGLETIDLI
jgi:putative endonuclease